mgnify:CR=1 FL=1
MKMHGRRRPVVHITRADGEEDRFIASFQADLLDSTFAVVFPESVTGAVALHRFACMIEHQYGGPVELRIDEELFPSRSKAVEEMLRSIGEKEPVLR